MNTRNEAPDWPIKKSTTSWSTTTPDGIENIGFNKCHDLMMRAFTEWQAKQPKRLSKEEIIELLEGHGLETCIGGYDEIAEAIHKAQGGE